MHYDRRRFLAASAAVFAGTCIATNPVLAKVMTQGSGNEDALRKKFMSLTEKEWKEKLTPQQFKILRDEGTEPPRSSELNAEKRKGVFHCAGCDNPIFASETKFESGTGWPSFYDHLPNAIETKKDFKMIWPRTEYHCARCGGHQGHVFKDGPKPTGLRYCNNGLALTFKPEEA